VAKPLEIQASAWWAAPLGDRCYTWARQLHAQLGRFINRDPIEYEAGLNLVEYVWNSPTNRIDPGGMQPVFFPGPYWPHDPPAPDPRFHVTFMFRPETVVAHPWYGTSLFHPNVGLSSCEMYTTCTCNCDLTFSLTGQFPFVIVSRSYGPRYRVHLFTRIWLDLNAIRRAGRDPSGVYGHEQQHVVNCRNKVTEIANNTLSFQYDDSSEDCLANCRKDADNAERAFEEWQRREKLHQNPESPPATGDVPPIGPFPPRSIEEW
jgi:RHS repeat-associated protein